LPDAGQPLEVFAAWERAREATRRLALHPPPEPELLRCTGQLSPELAARITDWFTGPAAAPAPDTRVAYEALKVETSELFAVVCSPRDAGGLDVSVEYVRGEAEPYAGAADLCADLRSHQTMRLRTIACDAPHPLLDSTRGGTVDQLRVVHDVFGHAALGLGFDLQSEFAAWLQCRALFGPLAQGAAFTELVGAVTAYVVTDRRWPLRADLAPPELRDGADLTAAQGAGLRPQEDAKITGW